MSPPQNWRSISGATQEILRVPVDLAEDIASQAQRIAGQVINGIPGIARRLLEPLRGQIENLVAGTLRTIRRGNTPRRNDDQNAQAKAAKREAERRLGRRLDQTEEEEFHRAVSKQGYGYWEMVFVALEIAGASYEELEQLRGRVPDEWLPDDE